ncbi:MAG: cyclic nucleotide-binding domain-containing protein, partial [Anaerolineales bacterium]
LGQQLQAWRLGLAGFAPDDDRLRLLRDSLLLAARRQALYAVQALGLLADPAAVPAVLLALQSPDAAQQANALETIDNWPGRDRLRPLLALWDSAAQPAAPPGPPASSLESLTPLLHDPDAWLRACAALVAGGQADPNLQGQLARLAESDPDPLVRATAAAALRPALGDAPMDTIATLSIMDRILFLKRVPLFSTLPPAELKQIAAIALEQIHLPGDSIARQGEPGDEMYIIVTGAVRVLATGGPGPSTELARRGPGDYVGEMAVISQEPRMASLVAEGDTRVLCIERAQFEAILRERPETSLAVMRMLIARLREVQSLNAASGV